MDIRTNFDDLFRLHYPEMVRYATTIVKDEAAGRDIAQELFIYIYEKSDQLKIETDIKYYLISGCRNRCLNYLRSGKIRQGHVANAVALMPKHQQSTDALELSDLEREITDHINSLPPKCAQIFRMNRIDGRKNSEIAMELEISIRTVETQISKALKILREKMSAKLMLALNIFMLFV